MVSLKNRIRQVGAAVVLWALPVAARAGASRVTRDTIPLLEPIGGPNSIPVSPGLGTWFTYFNSALPWLYNIAVGICILWLLYGGFKIMTAGDKSDRVTEGRTAMIGAILGIVVLTFAGTILRILNDMFFD